MPWFFPAMLYAIYNGSSINLEQKHFQGVSGYHGGGLIKSCVATQWVKPSLPTVNSKGVIRDSLYKHMYRLCACFHHKAIDCQHLPHTCIYAVRVTCTIPANMDTVVFLAWLCPQLQLNAAISSQLNVTSYWVDKVLKWDANPLTCFQANVSPSCNLTIVKVWYML